MALTPLATPSDGSTTLTSSLWNNEFRNIYNNALALISPLTGTLNAGGNQITNHRQENVAATPTAASAGRLVWHSTFKQLLLDDGAQLRYVPAPYGLTTGDIPYATSSGQFGSLTLGSANQAMVATGGVPTWTSTLNPSHIDVRGSVTIGGGQNITKVMTATGSCVWPAMNAGAVISTTIGLSGASVTNMDTVMAAHSAVTVASVLLSARVTSSGTVTVDMYNGTGATYNAGSGTLRVVVFQFV